MQVPLADAFQSIPMLPSHVQQLFSLLNDPEGRSRDVAELVCQDPSLATQTLRISNSAFFGLPVEVTSIHQAVVLLGLDTVQGIALASYFQSNLLCKEGPPGGWMDGAADHALTTAHLGRWLLQALGEHLGASTAFTAGLLHDIGKLAFSRLGKEVEAAVMELRREGEDWCGAELAVIGLAHPEAGGRVCERWDIPETLTQAVRHHHDPLDAVVEPMACVVHIADRLAHHSIDGIPDGGPLVGMLPGAWQALGLTDEEMAGLTYDLLHTLEESLHPDAAE
jgi:putative nucleotidyltransferase with HDIG domain